jgi:hypothetical protein
MIRVMLDTDHPYSLTVTADILATYADLADAAQLAALRKTHRQVLLIDRGLGDLTGQATIIDIETGAERIAQAPGWYDTQHARGLSWLTAYCSRDSVAAVNAAMGKRVFFHWVARLDGIATVPGFKPATSPAAVQVMGAQALGFDADLSLVLGDEWNPPPLGALSPAEWTQLESAEMHLRAALTALVGVR